MNKLFKSDGSRPPMQVWDMLSILVLIVTVLAVGYFALIFFNPNSSLNFLPPGGRVANTSTPIPEPIKLQPTWTASPTLEMPPTNTPRPTFTPIFTDTPFSLVPPTRTPKPTSTPKAPFTAVSATQVESTLFHPDQACNWAGVGGTVVDSGNNPVLGTVVVLRGLLNGKSVDLTTVSGVNPEYGQAGFEFYLGNVPVASTKTLYVQLLDLNNLPLSDKVEITTSSECSKNLVLLRFKKNR